MNGIYVKDIGDGLLLVITTSEDKTIQIDWGGNISKIYEGYSFPFFPYSSPDIFVLSHFHFDHYNGLLKTTLNKRYFSSFNIKEVYFPRIPDFPDNNQRDEFFYALFAVNFRLFENETGVIPYDFINAVKIINSINFKAIPICEGDFIVSNSSKFQVLWPPRFIDDKRILDNVSNAIEMFKVAIEHDEKLRDIHDRLKKERLIEKYIEPPETKVSGEGRFFQPKKQDKKDRLSKELVNANKALNDVANDLSLAFFEDNRLLFLGDLEKSEIKKIIENLKGNNNCFFQVLITPHHGTHWHDTLYDIKSIYAISSLGKILIGNLKPQFKEISKYTLATYTNGDIGISMSPDYCFPNRHWKYSYWDFFG